MEIEIDSKRNNPLLNRTEVYFTVKHSGEKTPNRDLIRSELADKLNAKKENIIVNALNSSFGSQETTGYAKIYSSVKQSKDLEREHILKRNKIGAGEKKEDKKAEEPAVAEAPAAETTPEAPAEPTQQETPAEEPAPEPVAEPAPAEPAPSEEPKAEEKPAEPETPAEPVEESKEEKPEEKKEETEEKKE